MNVQNIPILYKLIPTIQNYDWGSTSRNSFIRTFLKKHQSIDFSDTEPIAELWMGAHKKSPSKIEPLLKSVQDLSNNLHTFTTLDTIIQDHPEHILGNTLLQKHIQRLPFLFKIIDIEKPLSVQSHPDKTLAKILHHRDSVHYPDDNHKPELAVCIKDFEAIVGFRTAEEILHFIKTYQLEEFFPFVPNLPLHEVIKEIYKFILTLENKNIEILTNKIFSFLNTNSPDRIRDRWFYQLAKYFGNDDPGIISIYLFQYFKLKPGEAIFLGPCIPHAYLKGTILEIMANSDNVVRGGLTKKFKDIDTLIQMLDYNKTDIEPILPKKSELFEFYETPVNDFLLFILHEPYGTPNIKKIKLTYFPSILLLLEGSLKIQIKNHQELFFNKSEILFFPGDLKDRNIEIDLIFSEDSWAYLATTLL